MCALHHYMLHCTISWVSHYHEKASMHKHQLHHECILTLSNHVDTKYHLECDFDNLVTILYFR
jgi:hypothetical protein